MRVFAGALDGSTQPPAKPLVDVGASANRKDQDHQLVLLPRVADPIVTNTEPPDSVKARQFAGVGRTGIRRKRLNCRDEPGSRRSVRHAAQVARRRA